MVKLFLKFMSGLLLLVVIVGIGFFPVLQIYDDKIEAIVAEGDTCPPLVVAPVTSAVVTTYPPKPKDFYANSPLLIEVSSIKKALIPEWLLTYWLEDASWVGTVEEMKSAIAAGADVNSFNQNMYLFMFSPLGSLLFPSDPPLVKSSYADQEINPDKIRLLLANEADTNIVNAGSDSDSALSRAAFNFDLESARLLLEAGANIDAIACTGSYCRTALSEAIIKRYMYLPSQQEQMVKLLLKSGAVPRPAEAVRSPMYMAVAGGASPKVVSWLIEAGSSVASDPYLIFTASSSQNSPEKVKRILAAGADWNARTQKTEWNADTFKEENVFDRLDTAIDPDLDTINVIRQIMLTEKLVSLCAQGSIEEVKEAITQTKNVDRASTFQTPLMAAATDLELGVAKAKLLLAAGAKVNGRNGDRMAPLQVAAAKHNLPMVQLLLSEGAEVNTVDTLGRTALWEALNQGRLKCADNKPTNNLANNQTSGWTTDQATNAQASGPTNDQSNDDQKCPGLEVQKQVANILLEAGATSQPTPEALPAL